MTTTVRVGQWVCLNQDNADLDALVGGVRPDQTLDLWIVDDLSGTAHKIEAVPHYSARLVTTDETRVVRMKKGKTRTITEPVTRRHPGPYWRL